MIMVVGVVLKIFFGLEPLHADSVFYLSFIQTWPAWLNFSLGGVLALITGFTANQAVLNLGILGRISNLPYFLTILLFFMLPDESNFFYLWGIFFLQLAILRWVEQIPDETKSLTVFVFNASLVIGVLTLLQGWVVLYLFLVVQSLAAVGMVTFRRILIGLLGFVIPLYLYNAFLYLYEGSFHFPSFAFRLSGLMFPFDRQSIVAVLFIAFMLLMALTSLYGTSGSSTLRMRRRWMIVVSFLVVSAFIALNIGYRDMAIFMLLPSSIVLAKVLLTLNNERLGTLYLLLLFLLLFFYNT